MVSPQIPVGNNYFLAIPISSHSAENCAHGSADGNIFNTTSLDSASQSGICLKRKNRDEDDLPEGAEHSGDGPGQKKQRNSPVPAYYPNSSPPHSTTSTPPESSALTQSSFDPETQAIVEAVEKSLKALEVENQTTRQRLLQLRYESEKRNYEADILNQRLEGMVRGMSEVKQSLNETRRGMEKIGQSLNETRRGMERANQSLNKTRRGVETLKKSQRETRRRVEILKHRQQRIGAGVHTVMQSLEVARVETETIVGEIGRFKAGVARLKDERRATDRMIYGLHGRVDRLEKNYGLMNRAL